MTKTITLHCPKCGRKKRVPRELTDPDNSTVLRLPCDRCDDGGSFTGSESIKTQRRSKR